MDEQEKTDKGQRRLVNVYLSPQEHAILEGLAKNEKRTLGNQIAILALSEIDHMKEEVAA